MREPDAEVVRRDANEKRRPKAAFWHHDLALAFVTLRPESLDLGQHPFDGGLDLRVIERRVAAAGRHDA